MDVFPASEKEYARDLELPPRKTRGWVHEVEFPARASDMIHYTSEHDGPGGRVEFNVPSHEGKETTYHAKGSDASIAGAFTAPWEGKFYMMWENTSDAPVRVRIVATRHEVHTGPVAEGEGHGHGCRSGAKLAMSSDLVSSCSVRLSPEEYPSGVPLALTPPTARPHR